MRTYFFTGLCCPDCHEPYVSGSTLTRLSDGTYICDSCDAHFRGEAKVDKFVIPKIPAALSPGKKIDTPGIFKLPRRCALNQLESEYVEFMKANDGRFLITWPYKDVKFSGLMALEYLLDNEHTKAAIISDVISQQEQKDTVEREGLDSILNELFFFESNPPLTSEIDRDMLRALSSNNLAQSVLIKDRKIEYKFRRKGRLKSDEDRFISGRNRDSLQKTANWAVGAARKAWGANSVRRVTRKRIDESVTEKVECQNGSVDIDLIERDEWSGHFYYNRSDLIDVLRYPEGCRRVREKIQCAVAGQNSVNPETRLVIVPTDELNNNYGILEALNPELLIVETTDDVLRDFDYGGKRSEGFRDYLQRATIRKVFMFSTDPSTRHIYRFNTGRTGPLNGMNVSIHTIDSAFITDQIKSSINASVAVYPHPFTSGKIEGAPIQSSIRYILVPELDDVYGLTSLLATDRLDCDIILMLKRFIKELTKSPLYLFGNPSTLRIFKSYYGGEQCSYEKFINLIENAIDVDKKELIISILQKIYGNRKIPVNPLFASLIERITCNAKGGKEVIILVNRFDVRGTKELVKEKFVSPPYSKIPSIMTWKDLSIQADRTDGKMLIALVPPPIDISMDGIGQRDITFIGSTYNSNRTKKIIEKRLTDYWRRPFVRPNNIANLPTIISNTIDEAIMPDDDLLEEITLEYESEVMAYGQGGQGSQPGGSLLEPGDHAILATDENGFGVFLPDRCSILAETDDGFSLVSLASNSSQKDITDNLVGKTLLLDKNRVYVSFKEEFTRLMLGTRAIPITNSGLYKWASFEELFRDSQRWIDGLIQASEKYSKMNNLEIDESNEAIANYIASLNINSTSPEYIIGWWTNFDVLLLNNKIFRLYYVEHPKSIEDIKRIYTELPKFVAGLNLDVDEGIRSYEASRTMQRIRENLIKGRNIEGGLRSLYPTVRQLLRKIQDNSEKFKVEQVKRVTLSHHTVSFHISRDYGKNLIY